MINPFYQNIQHQWAIAECGMPSAERGIFLVARFISVHL
jgi:hypothetical protein